MNSEDQVQSRRVIEALRAGVPNRDAVQALGSSQSLIEGRFRRQLAAVEGGISEETSVGGTLIAGDFGSGKSHLLEYLQHIALENNFVCSKVVISKETPLFDAGKVYNAAIQSAKVPGRTGAALTEIALKIAFKSREYDEFLQWVNRQDNGLSNIFAATVFVYERDRDPEVSDRIIQFWSGSKLLKSELLSWLRKLGEVATYKIGKMPNVKELPLQRYRFAPRLMVAAGYAGWVILVDEVELIGRYSLRQRAKSYAEITRLIGKLEGGNIPGLTTVVAITSDFEAAVLYDRNDEENVPGRLRARGGDGELLLASQAERGMRIIQRDKVLLESPNEATIREIYQKVHAIHARAYNWNPPMDYSAPDRAARIRQHVKRWINAWDLKRLYPDYTPEIEVTKLRQDYSEKPELETPTEDNLGEDDLNS